MSDQPPLPPGKLGLPWVGETLDIARNNHKFYTDRFAKCGPIFKTRLFGINFVVVSGAEAFHTFATDPNIERGGTDPISVEQIFLHSLALEDGDEHHTRKDVMLHGIRTREAMGAYLERMQRIIGATISAWEENGSATVRPDLQLMAARLTGAMYTGDESEAHVQELNNILAAMREAFQTLPVPIPGTPYGKAIKGRNRLVELIGDAIERHRDGEYDDVTSRMLAAAKEHNVPEGKLRGDLLHMIFASQGGYFVPLTLITLALAQHPDQMARARDEVTAVAPEGQLTMAQLDQLVYLGQLSKELRRYFAMNSATFFGRALEEMEIGGYRIPKGWGAIGAIHITMRSPKVFDDPGQFDPDRFAPDREAALAPGSYVPHGGGARASHRCPGEDIVTIAVKMYLVLMLRRLTWDIPPQDLTLTNELFPLPAEGLRVHFTPIEARV